MVLYINLPEHHQLSGWDCGEKSSHSLKLRENMTFISLTVAPDSQELLTSDLETEDRGEYWTSRHTPLLHVILVSIHLCLGLDKSIISDKTIGS